MTDSLRNQLLGLGFKPAPKPERNDLQRQDRKPGKAGNATSRQPQSGQPQSWQPQSDNPQSGSPPPHKAHAGQGKPRLARTREDIDLAKAYAIRAHTEKDERIQAERLKQEEARQRREARVMLAELVDGKALNIADAAIARHFPYGGKIKRIYVTQAQLKALNAGELGVLQMDGRYLLVDAALLSQAEAVFPPAIALKVDPDAPAEDDPYADPQYKVPDDMVW